VGNRRPIFPMAKKNRKGRTSGMEPFVMLQHYLLDSPAWKTLKPTPQALYVVLARRYNGSNNGRIGLGEREAATELNLADRRAVRKAFAELEARGFITAAKRGAFNLKQANDKRATEWALTVYSVGDKLPEKTFMQWGQKIKRGRGIVSNMGEDLHPTPSLKRAKSALVG
jgi:hypothetical protein